MELFTWIWVYDKRLLCCVRYNINSFVYLWLVPAVVALATIVLTWTKQFTSDEHKLQSCMRNNDDTFKYGSHMV